METVSEAPDALWRAVHALDDRGLVALPLAGRYALAADALDEEAVAVAFDATARPADATASVALGDLESARHLARVTPLARRLVARHPAHDLVLLLPALATAPDLLVSAAGAVAVRVPAEGFARDLAQHFGPVTAMRAAAHGRPPPRSAAEARAALGGAVRLYVEGAPQGGPATVVDATGESAKVIRDGTIPRAAIEGA